MPPSGTCLCFVLFGEYFINPWLRAAQACGWGDKDARRSVSRVLSIPGGMGRPFLWDAPCGTPHATNPNDGAERPLAAQTGIRPPAVPIRSCSRWGLPCRPCYHARGALLPHRVTLAPNIRPGRKTGPSAVGAVCFLWHCPWGRPRRPLAGTVLPWSPDFPPSLRMRAPTAVVRPSGMRKLAVHASRVKG